MNLINCTHNCIHQSDGYCTLKQLNGDYVSPVEDCVYFCAGSPKKASELADIPDGDKL